MGLEKREEFIIMPNGMNKGELKRLKIKLSYRHVTSVILEGSEQV